MCLMGPCRITKDGQVGVCGATLETIGARICARGGRQRCPLGPRPRPGVHAQGGGQGRGQGLQIRDPFKLRMVAEHLDIKTEGRLSLDIANDVADKAIAEFGQQRGELAYLRRAPRKRYELWKELDLAVASTERWSRCCTAPTWVMTRTPSISWIKPCAVPYRTAGAAPCLPQIFQTSCLARPVHLSPRSTWGTQG